MDRICEFEGCEEPQHSRGLCGGHSRQIKRAGTLRPLRRQRQRGLSSEEVAKWMMTQTVVDGDCWLWQGATCRGYPTVWVDGRMWKGHRLAYHHLVGHLPQSDAVHHRCANRLCLNPAHLQRVSHRENSAEMLARKHFVSTIDDLGDHHDDLYGRLAQLEEALAALDPTHPLLQEM